VLLGNSVGRSLAALYQSQEITAPAGRLAPEPYTQADLRTACLPPADGLTLIGIHPGKERVLMNMIDPSVVDERDPFAVNAQADMYDPRHGFTLRRARSATRSGSWNATGRAGAACQRPRR
jgi:hypothetical protein